MHPQPQTVVNERGYAFQFPPLGLPPLFGEFVVIQGAIGPTGLGAQAYFYDASASDPRRYASEGCGMIVVERDGAVWTLPLLLPEKALPSVENFTLQARRESVLPGDNQSRLKVPNGASAFVTVQSLKPGPRRLSASSSEGKGPATPPPTLGDELVFWHGHTTPKMYPHIGRRTLFGTLFDSGLETVREARGVDMGPVERQLESSEDEDMTEKFIMEVWVEAHSLKVVREIPDESFSPGSQIRGVQWGENVRLEYAVLARSGRTPEERDWLPLPVRALKPGRELSIINQTREKLGMATISEKEWKRQRGM